MSKMAASSRTAAVEPMFQTGQVLLPRDAPWLQDFEKELLGFPSVKYDDQVDSTSQYLGWVREKRAQRFEFDFFHEDEGQITEWLQQRLSKW